MPHIQTQEEWEAEMAQKILSFVRNEIYLDLRFLDLALSALILKPDSSIHTFATDGSFLYFSSEQVIRVFRNNSAFLDRAYLHTVLHCIFSHPWIAPSDVKERQEVILKQSAEKQEKISTRQLWSLACDIAVEYTIDQMDKPCTRRILSWMRQQMYEKLKKDRSQVSAAVLYRILQEYPLSELKNLAQEFYTDDHCYWPKREEKEADPQMAVENQKKWNRIARQTKLERSQRGDETKEDEELLASQLAAERGRRSYREFLQKFSVMREEMHCDPEEFDLNYYTYGLRIYRNMPLIEPLESREVKKIREFVIAIDTSYSTSGELVKGFLQETADILTFRDGFFKDSKIRILQCDNSVKTDTLITGEQELQQFLERFEIVGGGGTDFRPVFAYVDELLGQGAFQNLGGLLYFTDGKGIYPKKRPDYKTAFLFLEEYEDNAVPPWAIRLKLEPEEFADLCPRKSGTPL